MTDATKSTGQIYEAVPEQTKTLKNWVLWKYITRNGKKTKIPYQTNGIEASVRDPSAWDTFENVSKKKLTDAAYSGIGFVFSADVKMVGVDFDHVRNPVTREWNPVELQDILSFGSYAEISPSGEGAHVICFGRKPEGRCRAGPHEMYGNGRFFTITGNVIPGGVRSVTNAQPVIEQMHDKWFGVTRKTAAALIAARIPNKQNAQINETVNRAKLTDDEIIRKCSNAKNSVKFNKLFNGNWEGYHSQSEADFALCRIFAFYTDDSTQMYRLMFRSGLRREKWGRLDYLTKTISNAIYRTVTVYGR